MPAIRLVGATGMAEEFRESRHPLGYIEVVPKPTEADLNAHYKNQYYQESHSIYSSSYTDEELFGFSNEARIALEIVSPLPLEKSLLDLGCGEGFFAAAFDKFGWKIACCDFSEFGISQHNSHLLPYFTVGDIYGAIGGYSSSNTKFGFINLQNVLEHVIDPTKLMTDIKSILHENSVIRIKVPNDYSDFQLALLERGDTTNTWFGPPDHLSYFNELGLSNLLDACGYKTISLQADFPIELFLANPHSNYWKNRDLGKGAHKSRVFCQNFLQRNPAAYIAYSEAAAKLGFGRNLIAYVTMK